MARPHKRFIWAASIIFVAAVAVALAYYYYQQKSPTGSSGETPKYKHPDEAMWDIKYENAPLDFHYSLSLKDRQEIYFLILVNDNHALVLDSLYNNASCWYYSKEDELARRDKRFAIPMENEIKQYITKFWKKRHRDNKFVSDTKKYLVSHGKNSWTVKEPYWEVTLGPIKYIEGKIIVGYSAYSGPLASRSVKYHFFKENGKWKVDVWGPISIS
ncbi:MAG TPA: hypothetical protein VHO03_12360 [Ignavibacteriales bacterium]|nr:hypothetical protein [Ignavibacteriales bacterium]